MTQRVQKFLAHQGLGSRREIERWIAAGDIVINGELCKLGQQIDGTESIVIRGQPLKVKTNTITKVLVYNKPVGEVVTRNDPEQRPTVFENIPKLNSGRWIAIGRLDINTSGLLLFTNDGELANKLMHPSSQIEREYHVRVHGKITDEVLSNLQQGVQLEDGLAKLKILEVQEHQGTNTWCRVVIKEGRNREIRRLWESQGLQVSRLIRIRFANIVLPRELQEGNHADLKESIVSQLLNHKIQD